MTIPEKGQVKVLLSGYPIRDVLQGERERVQYICKIDKIKSVS